MHAELYCLCSCYSFIVEHTLNYLKYVLAVFWNATNIYDNSS